jgi:hypothetical protein
VVSSPSQPPEPGHRTELNPAQQQVVDLLGSAGGDRPQFDAGLRHELRATLEHELEPVIARLPDGEQLFVSKYKLSQAHGCEARYLAEDRAPFSWSVPTARGSVAHKAIELGVSWRGEAIPADLVDETIARLAQGTDGLADWLTTCDDVDRAELRSEAVERVTSFFECFPPLKASWRPVLEGKVRVELFDARIVLSGKTDLALGTAHGTTAGKVLIDFKTGGFSPIHIDDLRFYALLETLKIGTPPRLVASYYLESAQPHPEPVTEAILHAALARTVDGIDRMVALLHGGDEPTRRTGPSCRWCPIVDSCDVGLAYVAGDDPESFDEDG